MWVLSGASQVEDMFTLASYAKRHLDQVGNAWLMIVCGWPLAMLRSEQLLGCRADELLCGLAVRAFLY